MPSFKESKVLSELVKEMSFAVVRCPYGVNGSTVCYITKYESKIKQNVHQV
jgi:hypothetical protein